MNYNIYICSILHISCCRANNDRCKISVRLRRVKRIRHSGVSPIPQGYVTRNIGITSRVM